MIRLAEPEKCSGCMACAAGCPKDAISIRQDTLGNFLPEIRQELCVGCGKCREICPELNPLPTSGPEHAYAVWSLDPENRKSSASGGAAAEFYSKALAENYWICGAEYTADGRVVHTLTKEADAIRRYKQSKYVYSETGNVYREIKEKLDAGERVLMISLPCKVAGLLGYLGKPCENLLTVDIVCHGTPSGRLLQNHIAHVAPGSKEFRLRFRQDNEFLFHLEADGTCVYQKIGRTDTYLAAFLEGLSYREACYHCGFARSQRISDLTICDFWGLGTQIPFDHPYTGAISAVLANTRRGQAFFDSCRASLFAEERPVSEAIKGNAQLNAPTPAHPRRAAFEAMCHEQGFEVAVTAVLREEMRAARKEIFRRQLRGKLRKVAGIFLKRYRG